MSKFINFMVIMSGLVILFHVFGVVTDTPNALLLDLLLNPEDMKDKSTFIQFISALEAIGLIGAVLIGLLTRNVELVAAATFTIWVVNMAMDFLSVVMALSSESRVLAVLIFSPFLLAYILSAFLYWRGRD